MTSVEWTVDGTSLVGLVGETTAVDTDSDERADRTADHESIVAGLESTVADAGGDVETGSLERVLEADPSFLVTVGEAALLEAVRAAVDVPVLPVDAGRGVRSVSADRLPSAVDSVVGGDGVRRDHPILGVDTDDGDRCRALFDVALVTDEPARISEYAVRSRDEPVTQFRADGVVVATPAGSHDYASDAGGPLLSPGVGGVTVVPVGPFVTRTRRWILPDEGLSLSVERDGTVALVVDGSTAATLTVDSQVTISADSSLPTLVVPESRPFFGGASSESD
ncbi:NAD(+)/NADH kinase [Natronobeatus ordinarius]|uniref:NAD(+)/NADH kinase n=1 Tax=Natronobeatus ordinarius TaxID=2963433 RepID=UPI0020CBA2D0|nr:NAD(+)/NADH kinase [Natronobeatus ordinarius]